ncbi:hypothetical protein PhCBS80983_g03578 [Powellomyces hirtus]|uniref:Histone deacetylase interacting domain-containing protein n=1 Tax=Powellomyces hirtus TaxID=109895 RepID=A0A507E1Z9_9FUNG|nr:hypothetical protein PhCBS80983_g03578 [Powellomyces hirtus]
MANSSEHLWGPQQHGTSGMGVPSPSASQGPQLPSIHLSTPLPPPPPSHPQQHAQMQSNSMGPTLPSLQQADLQPQTMPNQLYPYGGGHPASSSSHPPPLAAPTSSGYGQPLPAAESTPAHRMGLSHLQSPHDLGSGSSAPPPPPPPPPAVPASSQMQLSSGSGSNGNAVPELTSAESQVIGASQGYRPLNVKDALSYLDQVKIRFNDQPEVYNRFLDIMKDFKSQALDTPGVIRRVSNLFREHPELISGFNTFLPPGYKIEPGINGEVKVTTPRDAPPYHDSSSGLQSLGEGATSVSNGTAMLGNSAPPLPNYFGASSSAYGANAMANLPIPSLAPHNSATNSTGGAQPYNAAIASASNIINSMQSHGAAPVQPQGARKGSGDGDNRRAPVEFNHAINYVNKIKNRFSSEPETYKQFLEILQTYQKEQKPIQEVYAQVQVLFKGAPDLLDEFKQFLPDNSNNGQNQNQLAAFGRAGGLPVLSTINGMAVPQVQAPNAQKPTPQSGSTNAGKKNQKRPAPSGGQAATGTTSSAAPSAPPIAQIPVPPPKKKAKMGRTEKPGTIEELEFFDKCKKIINNKTTYNEFLKILNLFSQEIIEAKVLVERVEPFLSRAPDLFEWFKRFVKYEDDEVIYNIPAERPEINVNTLRRLGHSYRQLPAEIPRPKCSGRDSLCIEVLNDEWISHPVYVSETGFVSHKKTQFEEALHKCEEERYEFDMNIEANLHTIALLEPIARKIQGMNAEERNRLKFPNGLGGSSKTIYQRVIKKVYDKERGAEILDALHFNPAVAVPVVLKRLKQKDEEWKRSQRDWNKVWREIDSKNYYKALDHQGIHFKASDKKIMSAKSLVNEIEAIHGEQRDKRAGISNRYQFDFSFKDQEVFKDVRAILRMQAHCSPDMDKKVTKLLGLFTKRFFHIDHEDVDSEEDDISDMDVEEEFMVQDRGRLRARTSLRRNVLVRQSGPGVNGRAESGDDAMDTDDDDDSQSIDARAGGSGDVIPSGEEDADQMDVDPVDTSVENSENGGERRGTFVMYANNAFYVFLRQYQLLYSRLLKMKELSAKIAHDPPKTGSKSHIAKELGLQKDSLATYAHVDRYSELLQACHAFVTGDMDASEFEEKARTMFGTSAYLVFTVDKLCQAIIKQAQVTVTDSKSLDLVELYYKDRAKNVTSPRQEAMYRINTEAIIQDDNIYRMEYFLDEKVLTIQLLSKEEHISDGSVSLEDRWSLYVDHFVQLHATENLRAFRKEPFLKRNLPATAPDEPPHDVEARSGLEMKVCVNTYKMFFVDHTEDFFTRKQVATTDAALSDAQSDSDSAQPSRALAQIGDACVKRCEKVQSWNESERGWKRGISSAEAQRLSRGFDDWMKGHVAVEGDHVSPLKRRRVDGIVRWEQSDGDALVDIKADGTAQDSAAAVLPPTAQTDEPAGLPLSPAPVVEPVDSGNEMEGVLETGALVLPQIETTTSVLGNLGDLTEISPPTASADSVTSGGPPTATSEPTGPSTPAPV